MEIMFLSDLSSRIYPRVMKVAVPDRIVRFGHHFFLLFFFFSVFHLLMELLLLFVYFVVIDCKLRYKFRG